jgi:hypothetical protein
MPILLVLWDSSANQTKCKLHFHHRIYFTLYLTTVVALHCASPKTCTIGDTLTGQGYKALQVFRGKIPCLSPSCLGYLLPWNYTPGWGRVLPGLTRSRLVGPGTLWHPRKRRGRPSGELSPRRKRKHSDRAAVHLGLE